MDNRSCMKNTKTNKPKNISTIPKDILDDLSSRFIINIPENERLVLERVSFQVELAHWFYLDYHCVNNTNLQQCKLREFYRILFEHIPFLKKFGPVEDAYDAWRHYKLQVPTCGAILLNETMTRILLVQSYAASSWGFPKGKINQNEDFHRCAIRELKEETSIDISNLINHKEYVQAQINDQVIRLYFIVGIDENVNVVPQTRCEIKNAKWFRIEDLPTSKEDMIARRTRSKNNVMFYLVIPFADRIKKWIEMKKSIREPNSNVIKPNTRSPFIPVNRVDSQKKNNINTSKKELFVANQPLHHSNAISTTDKKNSVQIMKNESIQNYHLSSNSKTTISKSESNVWINFGFDYEKIVAHLYQ